MIGRFVWRHTPISFKRFQWKLEAIYCIARGGTVVYRADVGPPGHPKGMLRTRGQRFYIAESTFTGDWPPADVTWAPLRLRDDPA